MTGNEYQALAARTINHNSTAYDQVCHALHGIASESGEIHALHQKKYQGHNFNFAQEKSEVGDLLWFIAELCTARGWKLEDVMRENIDKLRARYPDGFDPDKSLHRKEGDT